MAPVTNITAKNFSDLDVASQATEADYVALMHTGDFLEDPSDSDTDSVGNGALGDLLGCSPISGVTNGRGSWSCIESCHSHSQNTPQQAPSDGTGTPFSRGTTPSPDPRNAKPWFLPEDDRTATPECPKASPGVTAPWFLGDDTMESRAHSPGDRDRGRDGGWDREGRKTPPHMHNPLCAPEPPTPSPGRRESVLYSSARYLLETKRKYLSSGRSPDDGDDRGRSVGSTPTGGSPVTPPTACAGTPFFCETDSPDSTRDQRPFPAAPSAARASSPPAAGSSPHLSLWRPVPSPSAVEAAPTTPPSPESPVSQQDVAESSAKAPQRVITVVLDSKTRQAQRSDAASSASFTPSFCAQPHAPAAEGEGEEASNEWVAVEPSKFQVQFGKYTLGPTIGRGSFGKVKVAVHTLTGQKVAVKMLCKRLLVEKGMLEKVCMEVRMLRTLEHPQVVQLYEIMEYSNRGELFGYIMEHWPLPKNIIRFLFQQLIAGVAHLHSRGCVHRDLKPENLLLDDKLNLKIADFGLATRIQDGCFLHTACGTPNYAAPEIISGKLYAGTEVDIWASGVILFLMACGQLPFEEIEARELLKKICKGEYTIPQWVNSKIRDLIRRMMCVDPIQRITTVQIKEHPFFTNHLPQYLIEECQEHVHVDQSLLQYACNKLELPMSEGLQQIQQRRLTDLRACYCILLNAQSKLVPRSCMTSKCAVMRGDAAKAPCLRSSPLMEGLWADDEKAATRSIYDQCLEEQETSTLRRISSSMRMGRRPKQPQRLLPYDVPKFNIQNNWRLGIFAAIPCALIFPKVYGVLKKMKMVWRVAGPYHVHSRTTAHTLQPEEQAVRRKWSFFTSPRMRRDQPPLAAPPGQPSSPVAHRAVTIGLQLYKIGQYGFLLNLYSVDTEHALAALDLIHILRRRITAELSFNY